jgi:hypothetical protein
MEIIKDMRKKLDQLEKRIEESENELISYKLFKDKKMTGAFLKKLDWEWDNIKGDYDGNYGNFYLCSFSEDLQFTLNIDFIASDITITKIFENLLDSIKDTEIIPYTIEYKEIMINMSI